MEPSVLNELLIKDYNSSHVEFLTEKQTKQYIGNAYLLIYSIVDYKRPTSQDDFLQFIKEIDINVNNTSSPANIFLFEYCRYCRQNQQNSKGYKYYHTLNLLDHQANICGICTSILLNKEIQNAIWALLKTGQ